MNLTPEAGPFWELKRPRSAEVSAPTWLASAYLAGARKAANDSIRATRRDRGEYKNLRGDLQGMIGEIVGALVCESVEEVVSVEHDLYSASGPVDDVDLVLTAKDSTVARLESKSFLLDPGKRYFLINTQARKNSTRRGAHGYLPVIVREGASLALIGKVIPMRHAEAWLPPQLHLRDPAVGIPLATCVETYFGMTLDEARSLLNSADTVVSPQRLMDTMVLGASSHSKGLDVNLSKPIESVIADLADLVP